MRTIILICLILTGCAVEKFNPRSTIEQKRQDTVEFIKKHEGIRLQAYKCSGGRWSIGMGTKSKKGETISAQEAERRMNEYLSKNVYHKMAEDGLTIGQYTAFASYAYNTGKRINDCREILARKGGFTAKGKWSGGLHKRRIAEYAVCAEVSEDAARIRYNQLKTK